MQRMRVLRALPAIALIAVLPAAALPLGTPALPEPNAWGATAMVGGRVYQFGGQHLGAWDKDSIVMFDPAEGTLTTLATRLPEKVLAQAVVVDPGTGKIYLFGGRLMHDPWWTDRIVRFDPATQTVETLGARLPSPRGYAAAAWIAGKAYIFGGDGPAGDVDDILVYDPATDSVADTGAVLPFQRYAASAVSTGSFAWIFGGFGSGVGYTGQIVKYVPSTNAVTFNFNAPLPSPRGFTAAAWDGRTAWVTGGATNNGPTDEVVSVTLLPTGNYFAANQHERLPSPRYGHAAVHGVATRVAGTGEPHTYVLGGFNNTGFLNDVVDYVPIGPKTRV